MPLLPVLRFNIRPETRSAAFYRVFVFPTRDMMLAFYEEQRRLSPSIGSGIGRHGFQAQCNGWAACYRNGKRTNQKGQLLFHRGFIGAGVVAHEMTHAARYWLKRKCHGRLPDERMARIVGRMTAAFWRHWYASEETR